MFYQEISGRKLKLIFILMINEMPLINDPDQDHLFEIQPSAMENKYK